MALAGPFPDNLDELGIGAAQSRERSASAPFAPDRDTSHSCCGELLPALILLS